MDTNRQIESQRDGERKTSIEKDKGKYILWSSVQNLPLQWHCGCKASGSKSTWLPCANRQNACLHKLYQIPDNGETMTIQTSQVLDLCGTQKQAETEWKSQMGGGRQSMCVNVMFDIRSFFQLCVDVAMKSKFFSNLGIKTFINFCSR